MPLPFGPLIVETKRRMRRRWRLLVAALALAGAGITAGVVLTFGGGSAGEIPWLPTRPQLGPANPPLAPACRASQLRATLGLQGATGNLAGGISITNRSSQPCALVGRPRLSFVGATSKWRVTRWHQPTNVPYDPAAPPRGSLRAFAPGKWASVGLWWSNWCGRGSNYLGNSGEPPAALVLTAPGGGTILLKRNRLGGEARSIGAPPCDAHTPSTLAATPFTPLVPQGPPSSQLPLHARIVPAKQVTIGPKHLAQLGFTARADSWLSYTVVLTNRSSRPFSFGPDCPEYTEGFGGVAHWQAYVLNCRPVGSMAPGQSVRFAMRIHVPQHLALPAPAFGWTLAPHSWNAPQATAVVQVR